VLRKTRCASIERAPLTPQTLALIPLYGQIKPTDESLAVTLPDGPALTSSTEDEAGEFDFAATLVVLSEAKQADLSARFRREADAYYVEAKRSMVSSIEAIPRWVYVIVAVLGWNEFVAVLRSPDYFTMLLLLGGAAYVIFRASFAIVFHD